MTIPEMIIALKSVVYLFLLWVFIFVLWRDYCLDAFRERIFTLRNELFLTAARGEISFDDPSYWMLRERLNASLRYAHEFTLSRLLLALAVPSFVNHDEELVWQAHMNTQPHQTQELLTGYRTMFILNVLRYMVMRSFFLAVLVLLSKVISGFNDMIRRNILPTVTLGVERLESEAVEDDERSHRGNHTVVVGA